MEGTIHKCPRCLLWFNLSLPTQPRPQNSHPQGSRVPRWAVWWWLNFEGSVIMNELIPLLWIHNFTGRPRGIRKWGLSGGKRLLVRCLPFSVCFLCPHEVTSCILPTLSGMKSHYAPELRAAEPAADDRSIWNCEPQNELSFQLLSVGALSQQRESDQPSLWFKV